MTSSKLTQPARYRVYQFFAALRAYLPTWAGGLRGDLTEADRALVKSVLPMLPQRRLFARMSPNDQRHAIAVAKTVQQAGYQQTALLQAALLHDVAKSLGQPIFHRVLIVLLEAFWPQALVRLSKPAPTQGFSAQSRHVSAVSWWRRPFVVHAHHPAIGADWARAAACDPLAVDLIRCHQADLDCVAGDHQQKLLEILQWADNLN